MLKIKWFRNEEVLRLLDEIRSTIRFIQIGVDRMDIKVLKSVTEGRVG